MLREQILSRAANCCSLIAHLGEVATHLIVSSLQILDDGISARSILVAAFGVHDCRRLFADLCRHTNLAAEFFHTVPDAML